MHHTNRIIISELKIWHQHQAYETSDDNEMCTDLGQLTVDLTLAVTHCATMSRDIGFACGCEYVLATKAQRRYRKPLLTFNAYYIISVVHPVPYLHLQGFSVSAKSRKVGQNFACVQFIHSNVVNFMPMPESLGHQLMPNPPHHGEPN